MRAMALVCTLALLSAAGACGAKPSPMSTDGIVVSLVRVTRGARGDQVPHSRVDALTAAPFAKAGRFQRSATRGEGLPAAVWFDVEHGEGGARRVELSLSIARGDRASIRGPGDLLEAMVQVESLTGEGRSEDEAVAEALSLALGILDAQVTLERGEEERVPALLRSEDPQIVQLAMGWVRDRRRVDFLPLVTSALEHSHPDVAISAVETLGLLGDRTYVEAILRQAPRLQIASSFRLYETLGRLGGPEALAFLEFAVRNEEDPALRSAARRALHSQDRSGEPGARAPDSSTAAARGHWRTP